MSANHQYQARPRPRSSGTQVYWAQSFRGGRQFAAANPRQQFRSPIDFAGISATHQCPRTSIQSQRGRIYRAPSRSSETPQYAEIQAINNCSVYVSNLHHSITSETLNFIFQKIGPVRNSYVATDKDTENSLGYGKVQFTDPATAEAAVQRYNGLMVKEQEIKVVLYLSREQRDESKPFTNIFVKNFDQSFKTVDEFRRLFEPFGEVTSAKLEVDADGRPKGFGFVNYNKPEDARTAVEELHGFKLPDSGKPLYVSRHKCKEQRENKQSSDIISGTRSVGSSPSRQKHSSNASSGSSTSAVPPTNNIFVKNIKGSIDTNEELFRTFKSFGFISSAVVMKDENRVSKGFGFVCFKNKEQAEAAVRARNGWSLSNGKSMFVGPAQKKEDRQRELRQQFRLDAQLRRRPNGTRRTVSAAAMHTTCNVCFEEQEPADCVLFDCKHVNCKDCLRSYISELINQRQVSNILCLGEDCNDEIQPNLIKTLVTKEIYERYDKILLDIRVSTFPDVIYCPKPNCSAVVYIDGVQPTRGNCEGCGYLFCTNCLDTFHGLNDCNEFLDEADKRRVLLRFMQGNTTEKNLLESRYGVAAITELVAAAQVAENAARKLAEDNNRRRAENYQSSEFVRTNCKKCPRCSVDIQKNGGCNHMQCIQCRAHFCWTCLRVLPDNDYSRHFGVLPQCPLTT